MTILQYSGIRDKSQSKSITLDRDKEGGVKADLSFYNARLHSIPLGTQLVRSHNHMDTIYSQTHIAILDLILFSRREKPKLA